jgi:alanine dehydrogenase
MHLFPRGANGHFNVLRGATPALAGVKVVGDYVDNHRLGLPSELALLLLMRPDTGVPVAILDATAITEMRTGAVTAVGAEYLARRDARVLGHVGARGTAYWNVRLLCRVLPELAEIRVHSRRTESRDAFAERLRADLNRDVRAVASWEECLRDADVIVEATRLTAPEPLLRTAWVKPGALVIPYGTVSAVELDLTDVMDKIVVDDWGQAGVGPLGSLRAHVDSGRLTEANLHAELGQIVDGARPGRERADERILFWHRGLSITDVALGHTMLAKAQGAGIGTTLPYR